MLSRTLCLATFTLLMPITGLSASCPPYPCGVHPQHSSFISVARSEILNIEDATSIEVARSEAKIKAKSQLVKESAANQRAGTIRGVFDISICQSGEFIYASIKLTPASQMQASHLSDEVARSIESQPTPTR